MAWPGVTRVLRDASAPAPVPGVITSCSWGRATQAGHGAGQCWGLWRSWAVSPPLPCADPSPADPACSGSVSVSRPHTSSVGKATSVSRSPAGVAGPLPWLGAAMQSSCVLSARGHLGEGCLCPARALGPARHPLVGGESAPAVSGKRLRLLCSLQGTGSEGSLKVTGFSLVFQ